MLATLIRLLGSFERAEEALHDAFLAAAAQWPRDGLPTNPRAWLVSAGRFKAIDRIRRAGRLEGALAAFPADLSTEDEEVPMSEGAIADDQLRLIFTCCHPSLPPDAQAALTLREVCGLTTEAIASAFLTSPSTIAQRIVRAKAKIRDAHIPYEVPERADLPDRLDIVLHVAYLLFNEGYSASSGIELTRIDLCAEAVRLARLLRGLLPQAEVVGLLALMQLHNSRRLARSTKTGDIVLLPDQDRSLWDQSEIREGCALAQQALASRPYGFFALQAGIAALHAEAVTADATDWAQIVGLYDLLVRADPSPVVALNRAVALSMCDGPAAALAAVDAILGAGELADYHLAHATRADLCRRLGRTTEAREAYVRALALARQEPERRFLQRQLDALRENG